MDWYAETNVLDKHTVSNPEDGDTMFLQNAGIYLWAYMAL
jgi:hypothetical protein